MPWDKAVRVVESLVMPQTPAMYLAYGVTTSMTCDPTKIATTTATQTTHPNTIVRHGRLAP